MEQVTLHPGAFIRGSQALVLQNNQNINLSAYLNGDIIQQALNGINTTLPFITDLNSQKISIGESSYILDKDVGNVENNVVQLSIREDLPFHVVNTSKADDIVFNTDQQSISLEDILNSTNDKSDNSLDSLNGLLQLSPDSENKDISDISLPNVKGNFTYAYQLTNGCKLSQISQNAPLTIPISSTSTLSNITPIVTTTSGDINKHTPDNQNSARYVILKGVNIKPRLLLNVNKTSQDVVKNGAQKAQVLPTGKVLVNKTVKNSVAPTVKKIEIKEVTTQSPINRTTQTQEIKSKPVSLLLKSLLKPRQSDDQSNFLKNNVSSSQQLISNEGGIEVQDKLLQTVMCNVVNNQLFISKPADSTLETNNNSGLKSNGKTLITNLATKNKVSKTNESHSEPVGRCTEDQLIKIQTAYQNGELNLDKNNASSIIYDNEAKIVCKLLYPEEFIQKDSAEGSEAEKKLKKPNKRKLGRPPLDKKQVEDASQAPKKPKVSKKVKEIKLPRTRSGRLSRPPRHIFKDFKKLNNDHSDISSGESEIFEEPSNDNATNSNETPLSLNYQRPPMPCKIPSRYRCPTCGKKYPGRKMLLHLTRYPDHGDSDTLNKLKADINVDGNLEEDKEYACSTCRRIYLGNDMLLHLSKYKNHGDSKTVTLVKNNASKKSALRKLLSKLKHYRQMEPASLKEFLASYKDDIFKEAVKERFSKITTPWDYLVERQSAGEGAVKGIISDLTDIINSLPSDLLMKTDSSDPNALQITDEKICRLLNISPGSYLANDSKIKPVVEKVVPPSPVIAEELGQVRDIVHSHCLSKETHKEVIHHEEGQSVSSDIWPISTVLSPEHTNQVMSANQVLGPNQIMSEEQIIQTTQALTNDIRMNHALSANQVLAGKQVLDSGQVLSSGQVIPTNQVLSPEQVLAASEVLSSDQVLSPNPVISPSCIMSPTHDEDNLFCKDVDSSLDLDKKVPPDLSDILLDKSSMDTVDEILNDRLNELMPLDVPSLSETQALARSIFSTNSLELHAVSGSTEDLLKSLENLAPELPPVSGPADFDFTVLSTDFGTDR